MSNIVPPRSTEKVSSFVWKEYTLKKLFVRKDKWKEIFELLKEDINFFKLARARITSGEFDPSGELYRVWIFEMHRSIESWTDHQYVTHDSIMRDTDYELLKILALTYPELWSVGTKHSRSKFIDNVINI